MTARDGAPTDEGLPHASAARARNDSAQRSAGWPSGWPDPGAAEDGLLERRAGVTVRAARCGRVLNEVRAPGLTFERSLNPYVNCELGCTYCFAREFGRRRGDDESAFAQDVRAKVDAPDLLRAELARLLDRGERGERGEVGRPIAIGTATDPYQPAERRLGLTRALLETLLEVPGLRISLTTKSDLVLRDLDLLADLSAQSEVRVYVSLTTPDRDLARTLEPRAPTPALRLRAVEGLARARIPVGVVCSPVMPGINDSTRDLRHLLCAAKAAGARSFQGEILRLRPGAREAFFAWLARERPSLVHAYGRWYARGAFPPPRIREPIEQALAVLGRQYRLPVALPFSDVTPLEVADAQLSLFAPAPPAPSRPPRSLPRAISTPDVATPAPVSGGDGVAA